MIPEAELRLAESPEERSGSGIPFTIAMVSFLLFPATFFLFLPFPARGGSILGSTALLGASAVASAVLFGKSGWPGLGKRLDGASTARLGALMGLCMFLVGGGMVLLATTLHVLVSHSESSDAERNAMLRLAFGSIVLTLVPTVAVGALVSLGFALVRGSNVVPCSDSASGLPPDVAARTRSVLVLGIILFPLSVFSLGLPTIYSSRSGAVSQPADIDEITPSIGDSESDDADPWLADFISSSANEVEGVPTVPSFSYSTPDGLSVAPPWDWRLVSVRELSNVDDSGPVAFSPDGRHLVYRHAGAESLLSIRDLESDAKIEVGHSLPPILDFAWSPDSSRLVCLCDGDDSLFWIVEVSSGLCTRLPVPFGTWKVKGRPWWWSDDEIGFAEGHKVTSFLDLDTLRLGTPEESDYWRPKMEATGATAHTPPLELSGTERCRLAILPRISSYTPPGEAQSGHWAFTMTPTLAVIDKKTGVSKHLLPKELFLQERTKFLSASDGSKVAAITARGAVVLYFGIDDVGANGLGASLPPIAPLNFEPRFQALIDTGRLAAFICGPLVNPLNQAVVGPDRQRIKGIARVLEWSEEGAELELIEEYGEIADGDIITDLHTWRAGATSLIDAPPLRDWWTTIERRERSEREGVGTRPERWVEARLNPTPAGLEFKGWPSVSTGASPPVLKYSLSLRRASDTEKQPDRQGPPQAELIRGFVLGHHRAITDGDMKKFESSYAEQVDFFDRGIISRSEILKDQEDYQGNYKRLSETVEQDPVVAPVGKLHRATYRMRSSGVRLDESTFNALVEITLDIQDRNGTLEIVRQRARVSDSE